MREQEIKSSGNIDTEKTKQVDFKTIKKQTENQHEIFKLIIQKTVYAQIILVLVYTFFLEIILPLFTTRSFAYLNAIKDILIKLCISPVSSFLWYQWGHTYFHNLILIFNVIRLLLIIVTIFFFLKSKRKRV